MAANRPDLSRHELVVAVCGGIAAFKTAALVSRLVQCGCGVTVCMTRNARRFIGPLTFEALTARPVLLSHWRSRGAHIQHLSPTEDAKLIVVAPATANIIGKLAGGIADDLVSSMLLGAPCPILMAPAMNVHMWKNPAVQRNVDQLRADGIHFVGPDDGWQACRATGPGRMSEPDAVFDAIVAQLAAPPREGRRP